MLNASCLIILLVRQLLQSSFTVFIAGRAGCVFSSIHLLKKRKERNVFNVRTYTMLV